MNIKTGVLAVCSMAALSAQAQYYYKDIVSNRQLQSTMQSYRANKVKQVDIKSFEADGSESQGFRCNKKVSKDFKTVELFTRANLSPASLFISNFDANGNLLSTNDSSEISVTKIDYAYDEQGRIKSIVSHIRSQDDDFVNEINEQHLYEYGAGNLPVKMYRVKNFSDTTVILFANDEKGNLSIEKDTRSGTKYYYYYDDKHQLTDVVQENDLKIRPIPDYIFEYDKSGNVSRMIATEEGGNNYFSWRYEYENGLRTSEKCYTKDRRLLGSVEYKYK